jgi:hypothetical protein
MEYVVFGVHGTKQASQITTRELEYLALLASEIHIAASQANESWSYGSSNFYWSFVYAGAGSGLYHTPRAALLDVVTMMAATCDDLSSKNLRRAYDAGDSSMDPSPFSGNAISEYGVRLEAANRVYEGQSLQSEHSLSASVRIHDPSLDAQLRAAFDTALLSISRIPSPFAAAINSRSIAISEAADAIEVVSTLLETKLVEFIQRNF